jgi:hypothetical protein
LASKKDFLSKKYGKMQFSVKLRLPYGNFKFILPVVVAVWQQVAFDIRSFFGELVEFKQEKQNITREGI